MSKLFRNSPDNVILTKLGFFSDEGRKIPLLACVERKVLLPLLAQGEDLSQKKNEMEKAEASFATLGSCILFKNAHSFLVMLVLVRLPLPFRCFAIQLALSFRRSLVSLLLIATLSEFHDSKDRSSDVELGIKKATGNLNDWKIWGRIDLRKIQIFFFSFTFQKMELDNGSNRAKIDLYCHLHDKTLHHYQTTITVRCW